MRAFQGDPFACFHTQTVTKAFVAFDLLRCSRGAGGDIAVEPEDVYKRQALLSTDNA